jgi:hypothetical protein
MHPWISASLTRTNPSKSPSIFTSTFPHSVLSSGRDRLSFRRDSRLHRCDYTSLSGVILLSTLLPFRGEVLGRVIFMQHAQCFNCSGSGRHRPKQQGAQPFSPMFRDSLFPFILAGECSLSIRSANFVSRRGSQ